jgi:osmotically inducible protein OsmC
MIKRFASANWQGGGKDGKGTISSQSTILNKTQYSFNTRFEDGAGTNPEELIASAHAGCFSMKLSFVLGAAGFTPEYIDTKCEISFDAEKGEIVQSHLIVSAKVPGISKEKFEECAADAKANCPISKLLKANITSSVTLV